ncbi:MAG: TonB-dependent receptor plug domain-containing protein [Opitutaceae bacterium]
MQTVSHPSKSRLLHRKFPLLVTALGFAAGPVSAQTAPAAPPRDEPVELSPFIIATERDTGWSANDTLSANRTKQALKDVPVNIDAITRDFMEDLGLDSADDVALFVANVYALPIMENDNHKGNFSFRGLAQANNVSRNYFRWYIPSDTYNVERIDFGKGSNSQIFDEVEPSTSARARTATSSTSTGSSAPTSPCASTRCAASSARSRTPRTTASPARLSRSRGNRSAAPASVSSSSRVSTRTSAASPASGSASSPRAAAPSAPQARTTPRTASG